jgi:uncharacterized protein YndB with AHSA1/START domain
METQNQKGNSQTFTISREFNAPREKVFEVFSKAEHLAKWWGPVGFEVAVKKLEFRPQGVFHFSMAAPDGSIMWGRFVYREIIAPERIVFVNSFSDENERITRHPEAQDWPAEMLVIINFTEHDGKTLIKLESEAINATAGEIKAFEDGFASMTGGYGGTFDQLETYLAQQA